MRNRVVALAATSTSARGSVRRAMSSSSASASAPSPPLKKAGYEAFGSFHTAAPEALFAGEAAKVTLPPGARFPILLPNDKLISTTGVASVVKDTNRSQFTIDFESWTYLNHGAFGGSTVFAAQVANAWRQVADHQPLLFNDRLLFPYVVQSIMALAKFVNAREPQELVLLPNATSGLHAVLQSVLADKASSTHDTRDQVVFCFSTRYGAVRKMLQAIENEGGSESKLRVHEEPLSLEESYDDDTVLQRLTSVLKKLHNEDTARSTLVIVDHITSNTGVKLPVGEIVQRCREYNVPVLVDGAHGLLNLPLDLDAINADYYVGNCHKWFCSPKGAAFLHVNKRNGLESTRRIVISPRVVSHGFFDGFQSAFMWIGLQDYSPWLAIPKCIEYWRHHGVEECRAYMHTLAQEATELLYKKWNMPEELKRAQSFPEHKRHAMRLVRLPPGPIFGIDTSCDTKSTSADAKFIQDTLHHTYGIEVPIKCVDEKLYVRISVHMYNTIGDYEHLAEVLVAKQE